MRRGLDLGHRGAALRGVARSCVATRREADRATRDSLKELGWPAMVATVAPRLASTRRSASPSSRLAAADPASRRADLEKMLARFSTSHRSRQRGRRVEPAQALVAELTDAGLHRAPAPAPCRRRPRRRSCRRRRRLSLRMTRTPRTLSAFRKQSTSRWISQLDGARARCSCRSARSRTAAAATTYIKCIQSGWRAMLVELDARGVRRAAAARYGNVSDRVKLVNAAVCDNCTDHQDLWFVDAAERRATGAAWTPRASARRTHVSGLRERRA